MNSIISELQKDAMSNDMPLKNLLKKALLVAHKLKFFEFETWVNYELNGYHKNDEIPKYRQSSCQFQMQHPHSGWQPIIFTDPEREKKLKNISTSQSIFEIEELSHAEGAELLFPIPDSLTLELQKNVGHPFPIECVIPKAAVARICESVRKIILDWALDLEDKGILGEEISFTDEEKSKATENHIYIIQNFQGNLGNISGNMINQNFNCLVRQNNSEDLKKAFEEMHIEQHDIQSILEAIKEEPSLSNNKKFKPKVAAWIEKMVTKAVAGTWDISAKIALELLVKKLFAFYGL